MDNRVMRFLENLIQHFSGWDEISYVYDDGQTKPYTVNRFSPKNILTEDPQSDFYSWFATYLSEQEEINYADLYKSFMKHFFNLWVNPTSKQLPEFNEKKLQDFEAAEQRIFEHFQKKLIQEYTVEGYEVVTGRKLIDLFVQSYDQSDKTKCLKEWLKPIGLETLDNRDYYVVDFEYFTKPIKLTKADVVERMNHDFPISKDSMPLYMEHILTTKRGIESEAIEEDAKTAFSFYCNMDDYLEENSCENESSTLDKLAKYQVDPSQPFIEAIIDKLGEVYINQNQLLTEQDVLNFVNKAYRLEDVDREAKSFERHKIFATMLTRHVTKNGRTHSWNSIH